MKPTSVYLNIAEFTWEASRIMRRNPEDVVKWLDNFCSALATGEKGLSSLADNLLQEADDYRYKDRERKKAKKETPPIQEPPKEHKPKRETKPKDSSDFERFWTAYPKKIGKLDASKSWERAKGKPPIDQIIDILENQKASKQWQKDSGQYIPNPSTWLNQGRWEDSLEKERTWEDLERELSESFGTPVRLLENHDINNQQRN